jgi:hypothetical protein
MMATETERNFRQQTILIQQHASPFALAKIACGRPLHKATAFVKLMLQCDESVKQTGRVLSLKARLPTVTDSTALPFYCSEKPQISDWQQFFLAYQ